MIATELPKAWQGYLPRTDGGFMVNVCCYCVDSKEATALAHADGLEVSHGCCPTCFPVQMKLALDSLTP